ncbi:MAG: hypothetical protein OZ921_01955 [Sorangiineae bacterium]|nr:hypothetical protein [Polyangiaceae bacterium]MEB2321248.1 hypothetical protein [Sorangiineae bacterium]
MADEVSEYGGPERRRHRVCITRNTEYHFRDGVCVAVRDRATGRWLGSHLALERKVSSGVRFLENGAAVPSLEGPTVGEALYFGEGGQELVTSLLTSVERPERSVVARYAGQRP